MKAIAQETINRIVDFGSVQKTLFEFKGAYDTFKKEMVSILGTRVRKRQPLKKKRGRK